MTLPTFQKVCAKFCPDLDSQQIFRLLDVDGSGYLTLSEFIKLFAVESKELTCPIDPYDPLPHLAREVMIKFGFDLSSELQHIAPSVRKSFTIYDSVVKKLHENEKADFQAVIFFPGDTKLPEMEEDELHRTARLDLDTLMQDAEEAQHTLRELVAPGLDYESWPVRSATRNTVNWVHEVYDPGVKSQDRIIEKAIFKYKWLGSKKYGRVRDMARVALQYDTCRDLLRGIVSVQKHFVVRDYENRFKNPSPLGWRDICFIVEVKISQSITHYCELQLQLTCFAEARLEAHRHYRAIRELLPKCCKSVDTR